jgi:hypothetical protein
MQNVLHLPKYRLQNIEGSENLNGVLQAKCTTLAKISILNKIIEGSEILNPAIDAKYTTFAKISIAKY